MRYIEKRVAWAKAAVERSFDDPNLKDTQKIPLGKCSVQLDVVLEELLLAIDDWATMDNPRIGENETASPGVKHEQA